MKNKRHAITSETVARVKNILSDPRYQALTLDDIGLLAGTSGPSVSRIKSGYYDHLLTDEEPKAHRKTNRDDEIVQGLAKIEELLKMILEALK